jgi:enterochelin esterase-like enzyme
MKKVLSLLLVFALFLALPAQAAAAHEHTYGEDGVCTVCGEACPHTAWLDGVCVVCGMACDHPAWEDGRCVRCHVACTHPEHDKETQLCLSCGAFVPHTFVGGSCPMCGKWPALQSDPLPRWIFSPCDAKGTVQTLTYQTHDYMYERDTGTTSLRTKKMCIYLPYGYNESEKYHVLILVHGMGDNERYWLQKDQEYYDPNDPHVYTTDMLDNMMAAGLCRKMIIVTPTFYRNSDNYNNFNRWDDEEQFTIEIRRDILPLIAKNFSTYAEDGTQEAISAAREHFGYAGLSLGSIYAYNSILPLCLDLFAWFACFSGSETYVDLTVNAVNAINYRKYPILFFYNAAGVNDTMRFNHLQQYKQLLDRCPGLTASENATFTDIYDAGHEYRAWGLGLYNFLLLAFAQ